MPHRHATNREKEGFELLCPLHNTTTRERPKVRIPINQQV